jgi:hypothetical protein
MEIRFDSQLRLGRSRASHEQPALVCEEVFRPILLPKAVYHVCDQCLVHCKSATSAAQATSLLLSRGKSRAWSGGSAVELAAARARSWCRLQRGTTAWQRAFVASRHFGSTTRPLGRGKDTRAATRPKPPSRVFFFKLSGTNPKLDTKRSSDPSASEAALYGSPDLVNSSYITDPGWPREWLPSDAGASEGRASLCPDLQLPRRGRMGQADLRRR